MYKILEKKKLNYCVESMIIEAPLVARKCEPGQFVIIRVDEEGERIPLTIADYDRENSTVTIIYQVVGYTTTMLSKKNMGEYIQDIVGPLGNKAPIPSATKVLGIGGGVGIAPLLPQLKKLSKSGIHTDVILGGRDADTVILEDEFSKYCDNLYFATNDGSKGKKGFVTDVLADIIENDYDLVITIGPLIMMKAVCDITKKHNIKTNVSLNPIMIDGTGMCGGCRVTVGGETKFACVDGPDFDGHLVDFDECIRRSSMYKEEEHKCKIGLEG